MAESSTTLSEKDLEEIQQKLANRMVKSGEWQRIQDVLIARLSESGWTDQVKSHAKEHARQMQPLKFDALQQDTADFAFDTLPDTVKNDILAQIRTYIVSQIDESGNVSPTGRR
ncbi:SAGA histone acetylase and TREX-2 complexes component [Naganishia albida]|nr:SAGA histone acetylase and TREX-2 complexes component [Naganishia albida]